MFNFRTLNLHAAAFKRVKGLYPFACPCILWGFRSSAGAPLDGLQSAYVEHPARTLPARPLSSLLSLRSRAQPGMYRTRWPTRGNVIPAAAADWYQGYPMLDVDNQRPTNPREQPCCSAATTWLNSHELNATRSSHPSTRYG